tara:strand:+ start:79 stop:573 length:495 start_codon:yes stop_codon:yes gene_type:complete
VKKIIFHQDLLCLIKNKKGEALNLGCGESEYSSVLSKNGWQVDLIDKNQEILKQEYFNNQKVFILDLENPKNRFRIKKIISKKYDLILLIKYTNRQIFRSLDSILRYNGLIFIENFMEEDSRKNRDYKLRKFELSKSKYRTKKFFQNYNIKYRIQSAILKKRSH